MDQLPELCKKILLSVTGRIFKQISMHKQGGYVLDENAGMSGQPVSTRLRPFCLAR